MTSAQLRDNETEQTKSGSAGKENERTKNEHESPESENKRQEARTSETLLMTMTTTINAYEGLMTCVDLIITLKASKASPSSRTLEGETMFNTFLSKQRRWLATREAAPTHLQPGFVPRQHLLPSRTPDRLTLHIRTSRRIQAHGLKH
jgi:hypothetical protein